MTTTNNGWTYSDELEDLILDLIFPDILKLHTKNKRPSTKAKHQKGLTRLQRDQGGEKKEKRMRYKGSNSRRAGLIVLIPQGYIGPLPFDFDDYPYIEIDFDGDNGRIEIFIPFTQLKGHSTYRMSQIDLDNLPNEIEIAWADFQTNKYFWIRLQNAGD